MTTIWLFEINGESVEEPIGFDAMDITVQRDPVFHGLENILSDNIKFWGTGAELIKAEYELNGIDGELDFSIKYSCDGETFNTLFDGILNCFYYDITNNEVTIKIEPSGFHRVVKNRLNTPINLNSNTSIDGLPMSTINPFNLGLHSKKIVAKTALDQNQDLLTVSDTHPFNTGDNVAIGVYFPLQITTEELETPIEEINFFRFGELAPATSRIFSLDGQGGDVTFEYKLKGTFHEAITANRSFQFVIDIAYGADGSDNITTLFGPTSFSQSGGSTSQAFDISGTATIPLTTGQKIFINIRVSNYLIIAATGTQTGTFSLDSDPGNYVRLTQSTTADPSFTKALLLHEAFAKAAESMTGIQDSFRSDFFGRTNSEPHQYAVNGCGAWTAITNGLNIRKMLDKNDQLFPIITTFNDLFSSCDAVWNLGMKIEKDSSGKEYIRVEPKEYFYNSSTILTNLQVSDLRKYPAQDLIFNTYNVGYEKWNLNITGSNGLDEYNSTRSYSLPIKKANNNLKTVSKYIASGYLIEQTRRLQYKSVPTNDFETDNDIFFICTNRDTLTSSLYTVPPTPTVYDAGQVSERNENFDIMTPANNKVLDTGTSYNLRISPARMAINWYKYLSASLFKHPTEAIKFISGEGNYQELDTMINDCIVIADIEQDQDLVSTGIAGQAGTPIYLPEYLEFTYPMSQDQFLSILASSEMAIGVSCGATAQYIGFIVSHKYSPTTQGGIGTFKLLRGFCMPGDFNDDFNNDFNVGNC